LPLLILAAHHAKIVHEILAHHLTVAEHAHSHASHAHVLAIHHSLKTGRLVAHRIRADELTRIGIGSDERPGLSIIHAGIVHSHISHA
jgi:hypothetical protein